MSAAVRVFFPCTGLGREARGFEAFTRDCAEALASHGEVDLTVFSGGGDVHPGERETWNLPRAGAAAKLIAKFIDHDAYFVEQSTFFMGFVGALAWQRPDLVYFADVNLGNACWHWRRATRQKFKLLYYNGGPTTLPFTRCDFVQQVSPEHLASAIARGESRERQLLLPHGVSIAREFAAPSAGERAELRRALGVPVNCKLVLSVGALNLSHKRMDYVIDEVATMPSRPHLLLLGADTPESGQLRAHAASRLGERCVIRTLPRDQARRAYRSADAFVLASLTEGFGLAQVEAMDAGLPCVAHDTPTSTFVQGGQGTRGDLRFAGALAPLLERALAEGTSRARERHASVYARFSWDVLAPRYSEMLRACAAGNIAPLLTDAR